MKFLTVALMLAFAAPTLADISDIPTEEEAFLDVIGSVDHVKMVELLGDPDKTIILHDRNNNEAIGAIVYYRYINTNSDGDYYKTTELDYVNGRLVMVVFSNSDFQETATAALPQGNTECPATC